MPGESKAVAPDAQPARELHTQVNLSDVALAVGLGALVAWLTLMLASANPYHPYNDNGITALERVYFFFFVPFVLAHLAFARFPVRVKPFAEGTRMPVAAGLVLAAATVGMVIQGDGLAMGALMVVFATVGGACAAFLFISYSMRYYHLDPRGGLVVTLAAFFCATLLQVLVAWLPAIASMTISAAFAVVSGLCVLWHDRLEPHYAEVAHAPISLETKPRRHLLACFCALVVVLAFSTETARSLFVHGSIGTISDMSFQHAQSIALGVIMVVLVASAVGLVALPKSFKLSLSYRMVFLVSLFSVSLLSLTGNADALLGTYSLSCASCVLVNMMAWALSLAIARVQPIEPIATLSIVRGALNAGLMLGFGIALALYEPLTGNIHALDLVGALLVAIMAFAYLTLYTERDVDELSQLYPKQSRRRFGAKCDAIAAQYGLSEREADVMKLLAMGHNAEHIGETLFISYHTVATHRKHIYQKLDIHSQQELIELLDKA